MELQKALSNLVMNTDQVKQIFITDKNGVQIIHASRSQDDNTALRSHLIHSYQLTMDHSAKLKIGAQKSATFLFDNYQIVVLNFDYGTAFILADADCVCGKLIELRVPLTAIFDEIQSALGVNKR